MKSYTVNDFVLWPCHCPARIAAQQQDRFRYIPRLQAYAWRDGEGVPRRANGDLFAFVTCPWCGGELMQGEP